MDVWTGASSKQLVHSTVWGGWGWVVEDAVVDGRDLCLRGAGSKLRSLRGFSVRSLIPRGRGLRCMDSDGLTDGLASEYWEMEVCVELCEWSMACCAQPVVSIPSGMWDEPLELLSDVEDSVRGEETLGEYMERSSTSDWLVIACCWSLDARRAFFSAKDSKIIFRISSGASSPTMPSSSGSS